MLKQNCPHPYHQSRKRKLIEKGLPLILLAVALLGFVAGRYSVAEFQQLKVKLGQLKATVAGLQQSNLEYKRQYDFLESAKQVDQLAKNSTRKSLALLHNEIDGLKEQVSFYQRIVAPKTLVKGLSVHEFEVKKVVGENRYEYQLTLVQSAKKRLRQKGKVTFWLEGLQAGAKKTLAMESLTIEGLNSVPFSFRYYELLSGLLELPAGFEAKTISLKVTPTTRGATVFEKKLIWLESIRADY